MRGLTLLFLKSIVSEFDPEYPIPQAVQQTKRSLEDDFYV